MSLCAEQWNHCSLITLFSLSLLHIFRVPPSFLSNSPLLTLLPHPGCSDGWYHHGDGSCPAWTTLLPAGRLWEVPSSGWCQSMLRLRSACWGDLVGTKGNIHKGVKVWDVAAPTIILEPLLCFSFINRHGYCFDPQAFILSEWKVKQPKHFYIWVKSVMT